MRLLEGYAWQAEVHDPNYFPWIPPVGTAEYETINYRRDNDPIVAAT